MGDTKACRQQERCEAAARRPAHLPCLFHPCGCALQLQDVREYNRDAEPLGVIAAQVGAGAIWP